MAHGDEQTRADDGAETTGRLQQSEPAGTHLQDIAGEDSQHFAVLLVSLGSLLVNYVALLVSFENKKVFRLYIIGRLVSCHHYTYKPST